MVIAVCLPAAQCLGQSKPSCQSYPTHSSHLICGSRRIFLNWRALIGRKKLPLMFFALMCGPCASIFDVRSERSFLAYAARTQFSQRPNSLTERVGSSGHALMIRGKFICWFNICPYARDRRLKITLEVSCENENEDAKQRGNCFAVHGLFVTVSVIVSVITHNPTPMFFVGSGRGLPRFHQQGILFRFQASHPERCILSSCNRQKMHCVKYGSIANIVGRQ